MVDSLLAGFWFRHNGGNDAHDRRDLNAASVHRKEVSQDQRVPDSHFGRGQHGFRHVSRVPDRFCRRAIHCARALDPTVGPARGPILSELRPAPRVLAVVARSACIGSGHEWATSMSYA